MNSPSIRALIFACLLLTRMDSYAVDVDDFESFKREVEDKSPTITLTADVRENQSGDPIDVTPSTSAISVAANIAVQGDVAVASGSPILGYLGNIRQFKSDGLSHNGFVVSDGAQFSINAMQFENFYLETSVGTPSVSGSVIFADSGKLIINNSIFLNNHTHADLVLSDLPKYSSFGGAITAHNASISANNVYFKNNTSTRGGALAIRDVRNSEDALAPLISGLTNVTFEGNTALVNGGALFNSSKVQAENTTFINNTQTYGDKTNVGSGGGAVSNLGNIEFSDSTTFTGNTADFNGGAILNRTSSNSILNFTGDAVFTGNRTVGVVADAKYLEKDKSGAWVSKPYDDPIRNTGGGAILNDSEIYFGQYVNPMNTLLFNGNVTNGGGGALYNGYNGEVDIYGGSVFGGEIDYTVGTDANGYKDVVVAYKDGFSAADGNTAGGPGGAIFNRGILNINGMGSETIFAGNHAGTYGGALRNAGRLSIVGKAIYYGNSAASGGGAISNKSEMALGGTAIFVNNTTTGQGGAIYNIGDLVITGDVIFQNNSADLGGGAIMNEGGDLTIIGSRDANGDASIVFKDNSVAAQDDKSGQGGAVNISGDAAGNLGMLYLSGVDFYGNSSYRAGAVRGEANDKKHAALYINDARFVDNSTVTYGGAVGSGGDADVFISNSYFEGNQITGKITAWGGAVTNGRNLQILNSTFIDNLGRNWGGAVGFNGIELKVIADGANTVFRGNKYGTGTYKFSDALTVSNENVTSLKTKPTVYLNAGNGGTLVFDDAIHSNYENATFYLNYLPTGKEYYYYYTADDLATKKQYVTAQLPTNGTIQLNDTLKWLDLYLADGKIEIGADPTRLSDKTNGYFYSSGLYLDGGSVSFANGKIEGANSNNAQTASLIAPKFFIVRPKANATLSFDVDLSNEKIDYIETDIAIQGTGENAGSLTIDNLLFSGKLNDGKYKLNDSIVMRFARANTGNQITLLDSLKTIVTSTAGYAVDLASAGGDSATVGNNALGITKVISAGGLPVALSIGEYYADSTYVYSATENEVVDEWKLPFSVVVNGESQDKYTSNVLKGNSLVIHGNGGNSISTNVGIEGVKLGAGQELDIDNVVSWSNFNTAITNNGGNVNINETTFENNSSSALAAVEGVRDAKDGNGGAIVNNGGVLNLDNTSFKNNTATGNGGAIYNKDGVVNLSAQNTGTVEFSGNTANGASNAIYNDNGQINIATDPSSKMIFNDKISGQNGSSINIGYSYEDANGDTVTMKNAGTIIFNETISNTDVTLNDGTLTIGRGATSARTDYFDNVNLTLGNGVLDLQNGQLDTIKVNDFHVHTGTTSLLLDVDLTRDNLSDKIQISDSGTLMLDADGVIDIGRISIVNDMPAGVESVAAEFINKEVATSILPINQSITLNDTTYLVSLDPDHSNVLNIIRYAQSGGFAYEVVNTQFEERVFQVGNSHTHVGHWLPDTAGNPDNHLSGHRFYIDGSGSSFGIIGDDLEGIIVSRCTDHDGNTQQALEIFDVSSYSNFKGAIINEGGRVVVEKTVFEQNTGADKGAVIYNNAGEVLIEGTSEADFAGETIFKENSATSQGGAIYNNAKLTMDTAPGKNIQFTDNTANGKPNDIYQTEAGKTYITGTNGGRVTMNGGFAGSGTISKTGASVLDLGGDNSGFKGTVTVNGKTTDEGLIETAGGVIAQTGSKFFGGETSISNSTLAWYTANDITATSGASVTLDQNSNLVVGDGTNTANLTISGNSAINDVASIIIRDKGTLNLRNNTDIKAMIQGAGTLGLYNGTYTFADNNAGIDSNILLKTTNSTIRLDNMFTDTDAADALLGAILDDNQYSGLTLELTNSNANKDITIDGTKLVKLETKDTVVYGGAISGGSTAVINNMGDLTLNGDLSGYDGSFNINTNTNPLKDSSLSVNSSSAIDYQNVNLQSGTKYTHTTSSTDVNEITSSVVKFVDGAQNVTAHFTSAEGVTGKYNLTSDINNGQTNTIKVSNSELSVGTNSFTSDTQYELDNVTLDLSANSSTVKDYSFTHLTPNGLKLKINVTFDTVNGSESDKLIATVDEDKKSVTLTEVNILSQNDDGSGAPQTVQALGGNLEFASNSIENYSSDVYEYTVNASGQNVVFTALKAATNESLGEINQYQGTRQFAFTTSDSSPYVIGDDLGTTSDGILTVTGLGTSSTTVSGSDTYSMFDVSIDDTTLTVKDLTLANAKGTAGAAVNITASDSTVTLSNVSIKDSTSTGNGGAVSNTSDNAVVSISGGEMTGNTSGGQGGAIYTSNSMTIQNTNFSGNSDKNGANDIYMSGSSAVVDYVASSASSISSGLAGDGTFNKSGSANLTLSGNNANFSGDLKINEGALTFQQDSATDSYISGKTTIAAAASLAVNNALGDVTLGEITGSGSFTKSGAKNATITGSNSGYTGAATISGGTLIYNATSASDSFFGGTTKVDSALTLDIADVANQTIGNVSGSGVVTKQGAGSIALTGNNSGFDGTLAIDNGTVTYDADSASYINGNTVLGASGNLEVANEADITMRNVSGTGTLTKSGLGVMKLANGFGGNLVMSEGALAVNAGSTTNIHSASFVNGTAINLQNTTAVKDALGNWTTKPNPANIETVSFDTLDLTGLVNLMIDIDLKGGKSDKVTAGAVTGTGHLFLTQKGLNVVSDALIANTRVQIADGALAIGDAIILDSTVSQVMGPIQKYDVNYSNGILDFTRVGGKAPSVSDVNPAILTSPVSTQVGGYLAQVQTLHDGFYHMDEFTKLPKMVRLLASNKNKYAIVEGTQTEYIVPESSQEMWIKPYTTFEKVNLRGGVGVSNVAYGTLYGGDSELRDLGHGYKGIVSAFVGYNGAHETYNGIKMNQQGGTLGTTGIIYKDNFFSGLSLSVGASAGESYTPYGRDHFAMLTSGIASKTGYNFEFNDGAIILQPSVFVGYSFVNTFDYRNAAGVKIKSDPLHSIQVAPGIKLIGNTKSGVRPYAGVDMVWNIIDKTEVQANDVRLPQLSIRPYVQYGVGVQKSWGERFTAFFQTMLRNGGRNGVCLSFGMTWSLGSPDKKNPKKPDKGSKKVIKSL